MKNIVPGTVIISVISVVAVALYLRISGTPDAAFLGDSAPAATTDFASFDPKSPFHAIHADVLAAGALYPKHLSPILDHLTALKNRLGQTAVWKSLNLDKALQEFDFRKVLSERMNRNLTDTQVSGLEILIAIQSIFETGQEFFFAASRDGFDLEPKTGIRLPSLYSVARFSTPEIPARTRQLLLGALNEQTPHSTLRLAALDDGKSRYEFSSRDHPALGGTLIIREHEIIATLGSSNEDSFFAKDTSRLLSHSDFWKGKVRAFPPSPVFAGLINYQAAVPFLDSLLRHASQQAQAPISISSLTEFESVGVGVSLTQGFEFRQCITLKAQSPSLTSYREYVAALGAPAAQHSEFERLITARTIFALRVPKRLLVFLAKEYGRTFTQSVFSDSAHNTAWITFYDQLERLNNILSNTAFEEIGVLVNAAPSLAPEFGLFIGAPEAIDLKELAARINEAIALIGSNNKSRALPEARIVEVPGAGGEAPAQKLEIMAAGEAISFLPISANAVFASASPALLASSMRLINSPASFLQELVARNVAIHSDLARKDYYFLINTAPLIGLMKPFIPLMLMQLPSAKVTAAQVEEVINQLAFGVFGAQSSSMAEPASDVCAQLNMQLF